MGEVDALAASADMYAGELYYEAVYKMMTLIPDPLFSLSVTVVLVFSI